MTPESTGSANQSISTVSCVAWLPLAVKTVECARVIDSTRWLAAPVAVPGRDVIRCLSVDTVDFSINKNCNCTFLFLYYFLWLPLWSCYVWCQLPPTGTWVGLSRTWAGMFLERLSKPSFSFPQNPHNHSSDFDSVWKYSFRLKKLPNFRKMEPLSFSQKK